MGLRGLRLPGHRGGGYRPDGVLSRRQFAALKLILDRGEYEEGATTGDLYIDGVWECATLEDRVRTGPKVKGETAIPVGEYEILLTWSPRFKTILPLLIDVPGFDGIRIHPGNTADDTEGCLLVGEKVITHAGLPFLTHSRRAFERLFARLEDASKKREKLIIEVQE